MAANNITQDDHFYFDEAIFLDESMPTSTPSLLLTGGGGGGKRGRAESTTRRTTTATTTTTTTTTSSSSSFTPVSASAVADEYPTEQHIDPRALCCNLNDVCYSGANANVNANGRPSKRRASVSRVAQFHQPDPTAPLTTTTTTTTPATTNHSLEKDPLANTEYESCFDNFCQSCDFNTPCAEPCPVPCPAVPCPGDTGCSEADACFNPECSQVPCLTGCADPECTKVTCPQEPCFCQKCDAPPCPMGDPENECHLAHSAPSSSGTIYCYDNKNCHFQGGLHHPMSASVTHGLYNTSRFPPSHEPFGTCNFQNQSFAGMTPASGFPSTGYNFRNDSIPSAQNCALCHAGNTCCHGPLPNCNQCFPPNQYTAWSSTFTPNTESHIPAALCLTSLGASQHLSQRINPLQVRTPMLENPHHSGTSSNLSSSPWMFNDAHLSSSGLQAQSLTIQALQEAALLDLAYAYPKRPPAASPFLKAETSDTDSPLNSHSSSQNPTGFQTPDSPDPNSCVCKWHDQPGRPCNHICPTPEALHKHIKSAHVDPCTTCICLWEECATAGKDFKQRSKLSRHMLLHAGHRPYTCSFAGCNKNFATNQAKDNHERTHTGEKPYVCQTCGYTTTTHTQLQTHISALHTGAKPHKCRYCHFTCSDSSNLSKHERTHQTLRPYRCPHPGCSFRPDCRWENLKRHFKRSGHCPELLAEGSDEGKKFREKVRKEVEDWQKRKGVDLTAARD